MTINLYDGVELSVAALRSNLADVQFFINAGGVAYLTNNGKRRVALVPVPEGEDYENRRAAEKAPVAAVPETGESATGADENAATPVGTPGPAAPDPS